jgi:hypothetical protein
VHRHSPLRHHRRPGPVAHGYTHRSLESKYAPVSTPNPYEAPRTVSPLPDLEQAARRDENWAIILGMASLVLCAPVSAPFALWKAIRAMHIRPSGRATVAIVLAILGLLSSAFLWFLVIWQILSPGR